MTSIMSNIAEKMQLQRITVMIGFFNSDIREGNKYPIWIMPRSKKKKKGTGDKN